MPRTINSVLTDFSTTFAARKLNLRLPPPRPELCCSVVVPVRNEEAALPRLIAALAAQRGLDGAPLSAARFEVILLLNNCTDRTAAVVRELQFAFSELRLLVSEVTLAAPEAHVGRARQALFDTAFSRFQALDRPAGLILTTDADSRPAPDWIAQNEAEIAQGVAGVGGRIYLEPAERAALAPAVSRLFLLDIGYRRALEEMRALYAPEPHDPFPRHHQHFGASLAVTAAAYARAGGMPLSRSSEDVALYRAVRESGGRFRHSYRVRVYTSARVFGRAQGGLADALGWWQNQAKAGAPVFVESAHHAEKRLARLGLCCAAHPESAPPAALSVTPEPPPERETAELHRTVCSLRERSASLRRLRFSERLQRARTRFGMAIYDTKDNSFSLAQPSILPATICPLFLPQ